MNSFTVLLPSGIAVAALMAALFFAARRLGKAGLVDVGWSFSVGLLAVVSALAGAGPLARRLAIAGIAATWSLRLGTMLTRRVLASREDGRYEALRARWGARAWPYLFVFFEIQALWAVLFALPAAAAANSPRSFGLLDGLGIALGVVAIVGEAMADRQLAAFRSDPSLRGQVCRRGLWGWSRHPNYFFEWLHWWAYVLIGVGSPTPLLPWLGPALMLVFLLVVTGIPHTERQAVASRGEAYRRYQREVSAFLPWPPKTTP